MLRKPEERTREVVLADLRVTRAYRAVALDRGEMDGYHSWGFKIDLLLEELQAMVPGQRGAPA